MAILTRIRIAAVAVLVVISPVWNVLATGNALDRSRLTDAQVKAGFLYNCALFVSWPFPGTELVMGVVGDHPVSEVLRDMHGQRLNGRRIAIAPVRSLDDLEDFHVLFVAADDDAALRHVIAKVGDAPILTVGEHADFTAEGGVVRLYTSGGLLRFEINMTHAEDAGLRVSSKMLGLAKIVR